MKFRFYDIFSHLISGITIYMVLFMASGITFGKEDIFAATIIGYTLGYFINTLSSWMEGFYYWSWGGKPSMKMLDGKDVWKVKFYAWSEAKEKLKLECQSNEPSNDELFQIAMRYIDGDERVADFNANYAFSRVMLTTIFLALIILGVSNWQDYIIVAGLLILTYVAWLRAKQRGYYFAREVLSNYLKNKANIQTK